MSLLIDLVTPLDGISCQYVFMKCTPAQNENRDKSTQYQIIKILHSTDLPNTKIYLLRCEFAEILRYQQISLS